jgi:RNA polymerase sigma-70 factor (ECF subfamily)
MNEHAGLAEQFEENRSHLQGVAYRMLGNLGEAEDAVQEAWLRLSRSDSGEIAHLGAWLTTVVARVCLDMLRSRKSRREEPLGDHAPEPSDPQARPIDPEQERTLADSVGLALLVVLGNLTPAERVAFVMHDLFDLSFDEIAPIVGRSVTATRQLASRARRRVRGSSIDDPDLTSQREVIDAYLAASRSGDMQAMLAILDPDVVLRMDHAETGAPREFRGATVLAERALKAGARAAQRGLIDGIPGVIIAPQGQLLMVLRFTVAEGKVVAVDAISDPAQLSKMHLAVPHV